VITWTNNTLQVSCVAVEYNDYPMVEWTVYLQNVSTTSATAILQGIQGLNTTITRTRASEFVLNCNQGDDGTASGYAPYQITLSPSTVNNFSPPSTSGKSCDTTGWPYYDLAMPGGGMILAIGWPGQWASSFTRDAGYDLTIQAGQQLTDLYLNPSEKIRTPLIALMFWQGTNVVRAQNIWRHWYMAHEIPLVNGQPPSPFIAVGGDSISYVDTYLQAGIQPNVLWRDADNEPYTWYPVAPYADTTADWVYTGDWWVDTNSYPNGFSPVSTAVHALGMKFLLWHEPERVGNPYSWLETNNPAWILPGTSTTAGDMLNEGNPGAFNWLTNHFEALIKANGIDWYREDMNGGGPLPTWQNNDAANRQGITENFYVQGHLAYWDALLAMNPGLRIDCCGSGGRRNDLEAMSRAVPLWRSDFAGSGAANLQDGDQCQTYALSSWLPFQGTSCAGYDYEDPYAFRSSYVAESSMGGLNTANTAAQQQAYAEWKIIAPIMLNGDYYPLTPYSLANTTWIGWQFDWPAANDGCVQLFRRTNSAVAIMTFRLQGLNPAQTYDVSNFDKGDLGYYTGSNLMSSGITVELRRWQSVILYYSVPGINLSATGSPVAGLEPLAVQFTATGTAASGAPVTYAWTFGDGGTSTNQNPVHTYYNSGRYAAQVIASDGQGDINTAQVAVTVMSAVGRMMKTTFAGYTNAEALTNFPVLMVFGPNLSSKGFSYSQMASSNGWDLVFMNSDWTRPLNYEIEGWNTNGSSYVWVQVPLLTSNAFIQAYWGDTNLASTPAASTTNGSVWTNGYVSVWHLAKTGGTPYDSTSNQTAGLVVTTYGASTIGRVFQGAGGIIGHGCTFEGGYISASASALPGGSNPRTLSTWFKNSSTTVPSQEEMVAYGDNSATGDRFGLWMGGSGGAANRLGVDGQGPGLSFPWTGDANWHYLAAALPTGQNNMSGVNLYLDGTKMASATGSGTINTLPDELCFAAIPGYHTGDPAYDFGGTLDEVRVSNVARDASWLWAEYMTVASNGVFSSYGTVTSYTSPVLTIGISGNNVLIFWPASAPAGAVLQQSPDLNTWTNSTAAIVTNGANNTVTIMPQGAVEFYRLAY
jgi:alpha-galactosidase